MESPLSEGFAVGISLDEGMDRKEMKMRKEDVPGG